MSETNGHTATRLDEILDHYTDLILFLDHGFALPVLPLDNIIAQKRQGKNLLLFKQDWRWPFIREQLAALVEECCHDRD